MKAKDLPGWGHDPDPDHQGIDPNWDVTIDMLDLEEPPPGVCADPKLAIEYESLYRARGMWALPPVMSISWSDHEPIFVSGHHRWVAAWNAGLRRLPHLIVHVPTH